MDRLLHGFTGDGLLPRSTRQKIHTLDGASGPLAVISQTMIMTTVAVSGKVHRVARLRPGWWSPRPGPLQKSRLWMNVARTRERPVRTMLQAVRQRIPPWTLRETLQRRRTLSGGEELHRLLNSRKGSLSATFKKNAEANDRAYDLDQKTIQALDALAVEYGAFETTTTNVTSEHEAGDVLHAAALEVPEELETDPERPGPAAGRRGLFMRRSRCGYRRFLQLLGRTRGHECKIMQCLQGRLQPSSGSRSVS